MEMQDMSMVKYLYDNSHVLGDWFLPGLKRDMRHMEMSGWGHSCSPWWSMIPRIDKNHYRN